MIETPDMTAIEGVGTLPSAPSVHEPEPEIKHPAETRVSKRISKPAEMQQPSAPYDVGATMLGGLEDFATPQGTKEPPRLAVTIAGDETTVYTLTKPEYSIGRSPDNDIVINSIIVSRAHAKLIQEGSGYSIVPSPDAGNPVQYEGRPLAGPQRLRHDSRLRVGGQDPGLLVSMVYNSPSEIEAGAGVSSITFGDENVVAIGRDPANDVVLNIPNLPK